MAKSLPSYDEALKRAIAESKMTSSTTSNNTLQHQQQQQQQYQQQLHNTLADFAQKTSSTSTTTTTTTMAASSETNGFGSYQPSAYNGFKTRNVLPTLPMQSTFKSLLSLPINANGSGGGGGGGANQNGASNGKLVSATPLNNNHNHNNIANNNAKVYFRPQDFRNTNTSNNNAAANTHSNNNNNNNNGNIPTSVSVQLTSTNSNSAAVNHITTTTTTTTGNSININNMSNTSNGGGSGSTSNLPNAFATDKSNSDKLRFMSQKNVTERLYNGLPVSKTPIIVSAAPPTLTVNGGGGSTSTASTIHNHASSGTNNNNLNANGSSRRSNPSPQSAAVSTAGGIKLPIATSAPALPATAAPTTQPASTSSASFKSSLIEPSHHQHQHHAHNGIASTQRSLSFKDNLNHMQQQQTTSSIAVNGIISSSSEYRSGSDLKMHYQQQQQHHHQHHPIVNSSSSHEVAASINIVNNNNNNNSSSNNNAAGYTPTIKTVTSQQHHHHHNHHQHQHQQQQQSAHLMKTAGAGNGSDSIFMRVQSPIPIIKDQRLTNANANANATSGSDEQQQQHRTASVSTTPSLVRPSPVLVHSNYQPSVSHDKASSNNNNNNNTNSSNSKQAPSDTTTATTTNNNNNNNKTQPPRDAYSITGSSAVNSFELNNMNTAAEQQLTAVAAIKQQLTATNKTAIKTNPMIFISNSGGGGHKPMATKQDAPNVDVDVEKFATALNEAAASVEKLSNNNNNNNDNNEYSASTLTAGGKSAPVVKPQQVFDPLASAATNTMDDVSTLKSAATINHVNNNNRQTITSNSRSNVLNSKSTTNLALNEHTTNPHHHQQHQQPHNSLNKSEDDNESFTFSVSSTPSLAPNESGNDTSSANASRSQNNNNNNNNNERKAINNARRDGAATPATYTGSKQQQQQMHDARAHLRSPLCKDAPLLSANVIGGQRGPLVANLNRHHSSSQSPSKAPMTAGVAGARRQPVMSEASTMDRPPSRLNYYDSDTNTFSDGLVANELLARRAGAGSRVAGGPSAFSNRKGLSSFHIYINYFKWSNVFLMLAFWRADLITDSPNLSDITERNFDEIEGAHRTSTPNTSKHKRSSSISSNELKHIKRQIQDLEKMYYEIFRIIDSERRSAASSSFSRSTSISSFASSSDMPTEQQQQPQTQQSTKQVHRRKSIVNFTNSDGRASQLHHERHSMRVVSNAPIGDHDNLNEMKYVCQREKQFLNTKKNIKKMSTNNNSSHLRSRFNRIESHLTLLAKTVAKISVEMKSIKIIQDVVCKLRNDVNCLKSFNSSNFTSVAGGLKELHRHNSDPNIQFNNNNGNNGNHPHAATNIRFNGQNGNNNNNNNNNNMQRNSAASGNALVTSASGVAVHTVTTTQSPRPQQNNNNNNNNADQIDDEETRLGDGGRKPTSDQMRRHQENMANEKENLKAWVPSYSNPKKLKKLTK